MKLDKEMYYMFLLKLIQDNFPRLAKKISIDDVLVPLTGHNIGMRTNELLSLYMLLCDLFGKEIRIHDVYSFWNLDAIAKLLMEFEDEYVRSVVQREQTV